MLVLSVGSASAARGQAAAPGPIARAFAIQVTVPGQGGSSAASVSAPPDAVGVGGSFAFPADGSVVSAGSVTSGAFASKGSTATASASAEASSITLFGGEVTVANVTARTRAAATKRDATADFSGSAISGMVVSGQAVATGPGVRIPIGDWAHAVTLQQGTSSLDTVESKGERAFASVLHVRVTADHNGIPAGTEVMIGYAEASAQAPLVAAPVLQKKSAPVKKPRKAPAKKAARPRHRPRAALADPSPSARRDAATHGRRVRVPGVRAVLVRRHLRRAARDDRLRLAPRRRTSSRRSEPRSSRSPTARSSRSAGTASAAGGSGYATARGTSSTTRISPPSRRRP